MFKIKTTTNCTERGAHLFFIQCANDTTSGTKHDNLLYISKKLKDAVNKHRTFAINHIDKILYYYFQIKKN